MGSDTPSHHDLSASQRAKLYAELADVSERMVRVQQLMSAVYGDDSEATSRAEQTVNAIFRLQRELVRIDTHRVMSAGV
jgi:hypothetical protein